MAKWKMDSFVSILLMVFYAIMYVESTELRVVARTYPQVLIGLCVVSTMVLLVKSLIARHKQETPKDSEAPRKSTLLALRDVGIICMALIAYGFLIQVMGYITSTTLFIAGILLFLQIRKWYVVAGVSLGTTCFLYFMFNNLLGILLPSGFFI